jgi:hypothetical protein
VTAPQLGRTSWGCERADSCILDAQCPAYVVCEQGAAFEDAALELEPCQPIGCDAGYHLPGCKFAYADATDAGVRDG